MKKTIHIIPLLLAIAMACSMLMPSCISDSITTSSSATLTFSRDTVSFDTVFTDIGTPTARLVVHNRNKEGVMISSIRFASQDSRFSLNVDGFSGRDFSDVEIRGRDSIYIFIECFIPPTASAEPYLVEDKLEFVTNGVRQTVQVEAWGQNVTRLRAHTIERDEVLTAERPYVVFDSLVVAPGATLRIEPGARVLFHDKARMRVYGTLDARGEPGRMISLRGDRLDNVLPDVGYDILAGQWGGVSIARGSFDNRLEYVDMRSTSDGLRVDSCGDLSRRKLLLVNSWLHNSQSHALSSAYARVDAYGCCFSEAAQAVVSLTGGEHELVQCTIANNYLFAAITQPLLSLYHLLPPAEGETDPSPGMPLMKCSVENSIIYGLAADMNVGDLTGSQVFLRNVLLKSAGSDDDNFIDCLWDSDPEFLTDRAKYYFNYRLKAGSPAIGAGNPAYVTDICLTDMDGRNRLADGAPDLGAYVYSTADQPTEAPGSTSP